MISQKKNRLGQGWPGRKHGTDKARQGFHTTLMVTIIAVEKSNERPSVDKNHLRLDPSSRSGYTFGMKTAVSIPDGVFEEAERLARRLQTSRSQLYARALSEFVARHDDDRVTEALNRVVDEVGTDIDEFTQKAAQQRLRRVEW